MKTNKGFTLIEVLISITLLALVLTILLQRNAGIYRETLDSKHQIIARGLAAQKMAEIEMLIEERGEPVFSDRGTFEPEGFSFQYGPELVNILNDSIGGRNFNHLELLRIGKAVSVNVRQLLNLETKNGGSCYSGLEFEVGDARVAILFPREIHEKNPKDRMYNGPIEVYSDRELSPIIVRKLLEDIKRQANLRPLLRDRNILR